MQVYTDAAVISDIKMKVDIYRDCGKIFFSVYDPATAMQRFSSIPEFAVHRLLIPNSVEAATNNLPPPPTPEALYKRLITLLFIERDRFTRRDELVVKRHLHQLIIKGMRICSTYTTVTLSECGLGELVVHVFDSRIQDIHEIILQEEDITQLAEDSDGVEREAFLSKEARRMVPFLLDRLQFRNENLQVRRLGGGGRVLFQRGLRVSGIYTTVSMYMLDGAVKVKVYAPSTSQQYMFKLSLRESLDLLGSLNPGNTNTLIENLCNRLTFITNKTKGAKICSLDR